MKKPSKKSSKENQAEDECSIEMSFARELSELKKNSETLFENTKQKLISENRSEMKKFFCKEYKNKMIEEAKNGAALFYIYLNGNYPDSWDDLIRRNFSTYQIEVLYVQTCVASMIEILKDLGFEESKIEVFGTTKDVKNTIKITF